MRLERAAFSCDKILPTAVGGKRYSRQRCRSSPVAVLARTAGSPDDKAALTVAGVLPKTKSGTCNQKAAPVAGFAWVKASGKVSFT
jgi:hypothetical protein